MTYCTLQVAGMHCGNPTGAKFSLPYYIANYLFQKQFDPVSDSFTQEDKSKLVNLNSFLDFHPYFTKGLNAQIFSECY